MKTILTNTYFSGAGLMDIGLERGGPGSERQLPCTRPRLCGERDAHDNQRQALSKVRQGVLCKRQVLASGSAAHGDNVPKLSQAQAIDDAGPHRRRIR